MKYRIKTKKAAQKRIKITGTGKLKRQRSGARHLLEHEDSSKKRNRKNLLTISKADVVKVNKMLPNKK